MWCCSQQTVHVCGCQHVGKLSSILFKAQKYVIIVSEISALLLCPEDLAVSSFAGEVSSSVSTEKKCESIY